jgi:uncharacterized protein (TIGR03032 family)
MTTTVAPPADAEPKLEISTSRQFTAWLLERKASLAFSTYQAGKLFFIGLKPDGSLAVHERTFPRGMGLAAHGSSLYLATLYQLWRFENVLGTGEQHQGHDALYVPKVGWVTGDLDVHDVAVDASGRPVFINPLFGCLATSSESHSFVPLWRPPFLSRLAAEDRCHLNGLAMDDKGKPRYATAVSTTDIADGWRDKRRDGGVVVDIEKNAVVLEGLSMPHSPRLHKGKLWLLNSGTGEFGWCDLKAKRFIPVAFCPGYLRGLAFVDEFAVVGLSMPRENRTFAGLALDDRLKEQGVDARCAIQVIDLKSGDAVHWLRLQGIVTELYDVVVLPGIRRPMALGFKSDEIRRVISVGEGPA